MYHKTDKGVFSFTWMIHHLRSAPKRSEVNHGLVLSLVLTINVCGPTSEAQYHQVSMTPVKIFLVAILCSGVALVNYILINQLQVKVELQCRHHCPQLIKQVWLGSLTSVGEVVMAICACWAKNVELCCRMCLAVCTVLSISPFSWGKYGLLVTCAKFQALLKSLNFCCQLLVSLEYPVIQIYFSHSQ